MDTVDMFVSSFYVRFLHRRLSHDTYNSAMLRYVPCAIWLRKFRNHE